MENQCRVETVTQKNVVKSKSKYDYDTSGRLTAATQWTNDTNADGVFNENDSFIKSESSYALTENNTLKYTDFVSDVVNVDGENRGNVSESMRVQYSWFAGNADGCIRS